MYKSVIEQWSKDFSSDNPLINPQAYHDEDLEYITWDEIKDLYKAKNKVYSVRLRLITDVGFPYMDLSYWHVRINGIKYEVENSPFVQLKKVGFKQRIYDSIRGEKMYIYGLFESIDVLR